MKRASIVVLAVLVVLGMCETARAQYRVGRPSAYYGYVTYYPYGWNGWYGTTAAGSYYQGRAAYLQSLGDYQQSQAQAAKNWQEAYAKYLENRSSAVRTYFELQKMNRDYREAELKPPTREQAIRLSKLDLPIRMHADEVDPLTGRITWPYPLQADKFAAQRSQIEHWFAARMHSQTATGIGSPLQTQIARLTDEMEAMLKADVHKLQPMDYVTAKRFLQRLSYEARFDLPVFEVASG